MITNIKFPLQNKELDLFLSSPHWQLATKYTSDKSQLETIKFPETFVLFWQSIGENLIDGFCDYRVIIVNIPQIRCSLSRRTKCLNKTQDKNSQISDLFFFSFFFLVRPWTTHLISFRGVNSFFFNSITVNEICNEQ